MKGFIQNAGLGGFSNRTVSSANWNEITETGIYHAETQNQPELPAAVGGLIVLNIVTGIYITQLCMRSNSASPQMWRRSKDTNGWGAWMSVMLAGDFGIGSATGVARSDAELTAPDGVPGGLFRQSGSVGLSNLFGSYGSGICMPHAMSSAGTSRLSTFLFMQANGQLKTKWQSVNTSTGEVSGTVHTVYSTANTTKASDGALKAASPVARIASPESTDRLDIDESDFEWCGYGVANGEARGVEIIREDVGVYRVTGAKSLASSGWRLLPPRDPDGSGDLGVVTAEQLDDEIIISLFRRKMVLADGEIVIQSGESIDVPANSWIDIRLDMPESVIAPDAPTEEPQIQPE
ncbi:pyocin knob domain-containing protein [uncultured Cedecea sp.]|uniref:pyocin knob domain-containing protein n=1 Tax=uncultured Cedecea sp. TaxID=988762 RepID=UPI002635D62F|nr:pyocin knob domain-containing protein [uncultured Cedecea sp.]